MDGLITRVASVGDIPAITEIYAEQVSYGTATFEIVPPDEAEMSRRMIELLDAGYPYVVAEFENRILGYSYAGPYRTRPGYRHTVEDSVYLAADARGRGIGGALLRQVIEESTRLGFRQMIAIIGDATNAASIRLHTAAGFEATGTLKDVGFKHGRWLDSVLMQRSLGHGSRSKPER